MDRYTKSLAAALDELGKFVLAKLSLGEVLDRVAALAVQAVGPADVAGITLVDGRHRATTAAYTDPASPEVDEVQYRTGAGPCLDAIRTGQVVRLEDAESEQRWPEFAASLRAHGLRSVLSTPLSTGDGAAGGLNLYSRSADPFTDDDRAVAGLFAAQAAIVVSNAQEYWGTRQVADQLTEALASRDLIGQAKGIVMVREGCDADAAFALLRQVSQQSNRKLVDVAAEVVRTRAIRT